ncbi:MAG: hypothetical protein N2445_06750 [Acidobacteria bacterium]|nr:hypothetical protein [Acidobacteriota bacterium]
MINLCKIIYENDGCYLCKMEKNIIDPKELLKESLFPPQISSYELLKFSIDGKIIEGCLFAKSLEKYIRFKLDYALKAREEDDDDSIESNKNFVLRTIRFRNERRKYIFENDFEYVIKTDERSGSKYIFLNDAIAILCWKEEGEFISPLLIGKFEDDPYYHFFSSISGDEGKMAVRRVNGFENIPDSLLSQFSENKDFKILGFDENWNEISSNAKGNSEDCFDDFVPYPPYEVVCALKLLPPEEISKEKKEELPPLLTSPAVLKTFLIPTNKIPVVKVSAGALRSFSSHILNNLYLPAVETEDPDFEYTTLYNNSMGYAVLARPQFPLKEKKR